MKRNILLFAETSLWGACSNFNEMFNASDKYKAYEILTKREIYYHFGNNAPNKKIYSSNNREIKEMVNNPKTIFLIFDVKGLKLFRRCINDVGINIKKRHVNIFWTGTPYLDSPKENNKWVTDNNVIAYAMMDLIKFGKDSIPLMQPYNVDYYLQMRKDLKKKSNDLIICHSPGAKGKTNLKGTKQIENVISQIQKKYKNVKYIQIGSKSSFLSHEACIKIKSTADIFIDKCGKHTAGGIGKSGLESISFGIPTISAMHDSKYDNRYKDLYIIPSTTEKELYDQLVLLIENKSYYNEVVQKTLVSASIIDYPTTLTYMEKTMAR